MPETYTPSTLTETLIWFISLLILAAFLISLRKSPPKPPVYDVALHAKHRRIQARQLGEAYRDDGHTLPQVLYAVAFVAAALLCVPAAYAICCAVLGMHEPKW